MKITVDTNFLISATQWDYSVAHKLLKRLIRENIEIFSTKEILEEFLGILIRDFDYDSKEADDVVSKLLKFLNLVEPVRRIAIISTDPADDKIIECAIESFSDYILTYDKHLLILKDFEKIRIIKPEEFLKILD